MLDELQNDGSDRGISDVVILASTNTDIPTYYSKWLREQITAGVVRVPAYRDPSLTYAVSLNQSDIRGYVFWSKNYGPFLRDCADLIRGPATFFFTLGDPRVLGARVPKWSILLAQLDGLISRFGAENVIWKLPPIMFDSSGTLLFESDIKGIARELEKHGVRACLGELYSPNFHPRAINQRMAAVGLGDLATDMTAVMWQNLANLFEHLEHQANLKVLEVDSEIQPGFCIDDIENRVNAFDIGRMGMPCPTKCIYCDTNYTVNYNNDGSRRESLVMDPSGHAVGLEPYFRSLGMGVDGPDNARSSPYSVELRRRVEIDINGSDRTVLVNVLGNADDSRHAYLDHLQGPAMGMPRLGAEGFSAPANQSREDKSDGANG